MGIASISHFDLDLRENSDSCQPRDNFGLSFNVSPAKHLVKWKIKYDQYLKSSVHTTFVIFFFILQSFKVKVYPLSLFQAYVVQSRDIVILFWFSILLGLDFGAWYPVAKLSPRFACFLKFYTP